MLAESNQEGSRRQSGTRNKPKGRAGVWIYRWEIGKALQARKHCEKGHTGFLGGWVGILRELRKKKAQQEAENRRANSEGRRCNSTEKKESQRFLTTQVMETRPPARIPTDRETEIMKGKHAHGSQSEGERGQEPGVLGISLVIFP